MNNIGNNANVRGIDAQNSAIPANSGMSLNTFAPQLNYDKFLLNSLNGLATINRPIMQINSVEQIFNCNGTIGNFKQGISGDSWLLSGLKSLYYTTEGSRLIKQALTNNPDGSVTVKLKGLNKSYTITPKEFREAATKRVVFEDIDIDGSKVLTNVKVYSKGDSTTLAFELAFEKMRKDIQNGNIDATKPDYALKSSQNAQNPLDGGLAAQVYYALSGNEVCTISNSDVISPDGSYNALKSNSEAFLGFLENYEKNPNKYAASFNFKDNKIVKDVYGRSIKLAPKHIYALKSADFNTVMLSDPKNSEQIIRLPKETFVEEVDMLNYQDMFEQNSEFDKPIKEYSQKYTETCDYINEN